MDQVLIIAGLGDKTKPLNRVTRHWPKKYGLQPTTYAFMWGDPVETYAEKQAAILDEVKQLAGLGKLSIIGISAGGHEAMRLASEYPELVSCAVSICAPKGIKNMDRRLEENPLLRHSLELMEHQRLLPEKIMTMRPLLDVVVSVDNVAVDGATNVQMHTVGHVASIAWAMTGRPKTIVNFINKH